jgi:hypothetical protein
VALVPSPDLDELFRCDPLGVVRMAHTTTSLR